MTSRTSRKAWIPFLCNAFTVALLIVVLFKSMAATTVTEGSTPLALTPGAPAGSYPLSSFDQMNPYNGNISFNSRSSYKPSWSYLCACRNGVSYWRAR